MAQLRREYDEFARRDAEVIAVGPENAERFKSFWDEHEMPFPGIPDPEHRAADLYGQKVSLIRGGRMPAMFVIDKAGTVRYKHYANSMADIPRNRDILALLDGLNREGK